ncbi:hypothetical protein, partial [Streptomyces sp. NPDC091259]|uniref:hypothetical protein n=1 Tax=Streptomyces sp. NPDC091259 TaxID=3365976 RepID=UPI0037F2BB00
MSRAEGADAGPGVAGAWAGPVGGADVVILCFSGRRLRNFLEADVARDRFGLAEVLGAAEAAA